MRRRVRAHGGAHARIRARAHGRVRSRMIRRVYARDGDHALRGNVHLHARVHALRSSDHVHGDVHLRADVRSRMNTPLCVRVYACVLVRRS